ncbi:PAS domain S-box protein [Cyclobacterium sediminis]
MKNPNFENILIITNNTKHYLLLNKTFEEFKEADQQLLWCKSVKEIPQINFDCVLFTVESTNQNFGNIIRQLNHSLIQVPLIALTSQENLTFTIKLLDQGVEDFLVLERLDKFQLFKSLTTSYRKNRFDRNSTDNEKSANYPSLNLDKNFYKVLFDESSVAQFLCRADDLSIIQSSKKATELSVLTGHKVEFIYEVFSAAKDWLIQNIINKATYKTSATIQTVLTPKENNSEPLTLKIKIQWIDNKNYPLVLISCLDITELEKTKESLNKSKNSYQLVLQATNNVTWEYDIGLDKLEWSENFTSLFGYRSEQISNITELAEKIHPEDREVTLDDFKKALSGMDQKWNGNYRFQKSDGSYAYAFEQCVFIRNPEGKAIQAFGAMQDVTLKKESEHQLSLMEKVVKSANDPILITEVDEINPSGPKVIFANDAFLTQTGYSKEEIVGKSPRILQGEKSNKKELKRLKKALIKGYPCRIETINYKKDGTEFWVEFSVVPISDENGLITNWISIQRQVTDFVKKRELEDLFRKMNLAVAQPKNIEDKFSALLKVILNYTDLEVAEGWIMNIDNSKLNKVITSTSKAKYEDFPKLRSSFKEAKYGARLPGIAWEKGQIIFWEDSRNNADIVGIDEMKIFGLNSAIGIPIFNNKDLVGVITIFTSKKQIQLEQHFPFFESLSNRLGLEIMRLKSENELLTIFELIPNLLIVTDAKGVVVKGNKEASKTFECTETELKGISFRNMIPFSDRIKFDDFVAKIEQSRKIDEIDIPILINDQIKWINLTATFLPSESFIYCVGKDITHQKYLEDLIKRTNEIVKIGTWEVNLSQNKLYWSPMTKFIHDLDEDYIPNLGSAINFYTEGQSRDLIKKKVDLATKGNISHFELDAQLDTAKGRTIWVRVQAETEWINGKLHRIYGSIQDIDERKKTEQEIMEAKMRYELASKASTIGVWDWNMEKNTIVWDETMQKLYQRNISNSVDQYAEWKLSLHPEDREAQDSLIQEALMGNKDYNTQFRIILPDSGEIRFIKAVAYIVRNNSDKPVRMVGINYDVTEEEVYKKELERVNREREEILGSITDGFFSVDKDWVVTYWNKAAEKILQKPREEIVGRNVWEVYGDAIDLKFFKEYAITMETGEQRQFVEYYPGKDIWLEISSFPKENGIVVYFKNITARIRQHQKLAEVKLLQEHVINSTEDLIWAVDDQYKLILANNAFFDEMERVSGYRLKLGERVANFVGDDTPFYEDANNFWNEKYKNVLTGLQQNLTFESKIPNKESKIYQVGFYPIFEKLGKNNIIGAACFSKNITDKINQIKAIEEQNKKLGVIAWKQSHEVRAPVARILGLLNLQKEMNYQGEDLEEILNYLMDSSLELDKIIRDISKKINDK